MVFGFFFVFGIRGVCLFHCDDWGFHYYGSSPFFLCCRFYDVTTRRMNACVSRFSHAEEEEKNHRVSSFRDENQQRRFFSTRRRLAVVRLVSVFVSSRLRSWPDPEKVDAVYSLVVVAVSRGGRTRAVAAAARGLRCSLPRKSRLCPSSPSSLRRQLATWRDSRFVSFAVRGSCPRCQQRRSAARDLHGRDGRPPSSAWRRNAASPADNDDVFAAAGKEQVGGDADDDGSDAAAAAEKRRTSCCCWRCCCSGGRWRRNDFVACWSEDKARSCTLR